MKTQGDPVAVRSLKVENGFLFIATIGKLEKGTIS